MMLRTGVCRKNSLSELHQLTVFFIVIKLTLHTADSRVSLLPSQVGVLVIVVFMPLLLLLLLTKPLWYITGRWFRACTG